MSEHKHDCPKCNGYWVCDGDDCGPDDLCCNCRTAPPNRCPLDDERVRELAADATRSAMSETRTDLFTEVEQAIRTAATEAAQAEREACARLADDESEWSDDRCATVAAAIRSRGEG